MLNLQIAFDQPWWLLLLALVPLLWIFSFQSLSGLGPYRRLFALLFRTLVFTLLVLALAGVQLQKISDRVTVIYLLDQSESIPKLTREAMLTYVKEDVKAHRRAGDLTSASEDKAGVIIFGREATIEHPPFAAEIQSVGVLESLFDLRTDATNIASALKLAQASFPEDSAKRVVIITDGHENLGDARTVARTLADAGIGIDVIPIRLDSQAEVAVEKIALPPDIRRGQPLEARVVLENYAKGEVKGRLRVTRRYSNQDEPLGDGDIPVTLKPGKNVFTFQHTIDVPAGYTYRADFVPDDAAADVQLQNNSASTFTHVRGKGRVLLIEDWESPREFDTLVQRLGEKNIEVEVMPSDRLFTSLAELQGFDCVVLGNVPRASGGGDATTRDATNFSDDQISMLVRNTEQFGCGLVMIGGANSFGAGGWTNTELEKAMPVDFQIKNAKVKAIGALVMVMHASEIPEGNHWQKVIAEEALKVLGPSDYCGTLYWDNFSGADASWLWKDAATGRGLAQVRDRQKIWMGRNGRMAPGDMPAFEPAMKMALNDFIPNPASIKHMIMISDGDPSPPSPLLLGRFKLNSIKISTVAVGAHGPAESSLLQMIATTTGGKFYRVNNPRALPRIFQIEARKVARPLVKELPRIPIDVEDPSHEMLVGLSPPQPVTGFVLTQRKENPLVEVLMSAKDIDPENGTILAAWRYGAGKTVALTTDAGAKWAHSWTGSEEYDKFFSQMIRYAMRPVNEEGKFNVAADVKDGRVRVVVTALDKNDEFLNFLNMSGAGTGPDLDTVDMGFRQEAPGRYVAEFPADKAGSYLLAINTGQANAAPLLTGITVPYSAEFRERETNQALLTTLASTKPTGGQPGQVIEGQLAKGTIDRLVASVDTFRRTLAKALSSEDFWPIFLLIAAGIFLIDVFIRRVTVHFYWVMPAVAYAYNRVRGRDQPAAPDERLARLRSRKAAISSQIDERRAAARFEPVVEDAVGAPRDYEQVIADASAGSTGADAPRPMSQPQSQTPQTEQETYTERLLAAKKKAKGP